MLFSLSSEGYVLDMIPVVKRYVYYMILVVKKYVLDMIPVVYDMYII